ncbi:glutathione S-transferase 1-like isoform X1 [Varroa jacobsoni]|uniref:glutathione S-transferase 1-like isoform X1 n=1 Tax=Varroa jacobsoni TaxID=62625 RepID=UPI000BF608C0|nr:glutathione S-transferase 1-like isoform X1 [Varroa jacobsoni]
MTPAAPILLYMHDWFPPSRAATWILRSAEVPYELKPITTRGETSKPWYHKLNPQHTIPTLVDGDFALGESRAISTYLINKYAPGHRLYPDCPQKRALIDRYLYFDIGTLYKSIGDYFYPKLMFNKELEPDREKKLKDALGFLEAFLNGQDFLLGKEPTVADLSISCSLSMLEITSYGFPAFPIAEAYYNRLKQLPHWEECNAKGIEGFKQFAAGKLQ